MFVFFPNPGRPQCLPDFRVFECFQCPQSYRPHGGIVSQPFWEVSSVFGDSCGVPGIYQFAYGHWLVVAVAGDF
jgi:hypothetical protein